MSLSKTKTVEETSVDLLAPQAAEEIKMSIDLTQNTSHILDRLTDLYSDPVSATVREVVSNATDATMLLPEALRKPVEISAPSNYDLYFKVQDHGVGMSADTVRKIYSQYGASTKTSDFSQIGAYGLGAKAPLSYTNIYEVATTHEGITTKFTVGRKDTGPYTTIQSSVYTGDESGTSVLIPVESADVESFHTALKHYRLYSFDVPVIIDGVTFQGNADYAQIKDVILDESSGLTGRVWLNKNLFPKLLTQLFSNSSYISFDSISYTLSGWLYNSPAYSNRYQREDTSVIVELKPGIVDFSSSRDTITDNGRARALDNQVLNILKNTDELADNLIEVYRGFDNASALKFTIELVNAITDYEDGVIVFKGGGYYARRSEQASRPIDDFTTDSGVNYFKYLSEDSELDVSGVFSDDDGKVSTLSGSSVNKFAFSRYDLTTCSVNDTIKELQGSRGKDRKISLFQFANHLMVRNNRYGYIVLTGASEEHMKKIVRLRSVISNNLYPNSFILLTDLTKFKKSTIDRIETMTGVVPKTANADEVISKAEVIAKAERDAAKALRVDEGLSNVVYNFHIEPKDSIKDVLSQNFYRSTERSISLEDLMEKNAYIVFAYNSGVREVLIGAHNAGIKVNEADIYVVNTSVSSGMRAQHLKMLIDYDRLLISANWSKKSKDSDALRAKHTYSGNLLYSEIKEMDSEQIVLNYIYMTHRALMGGILPFMERHDLDSTSLESEPKEILKFAASVRHGRTQDYDPSAATIFDSRFGSEYREKFDRCLNALSRTSFSGFEGGVIQTFTSYEDDGVDTPLKNAIFDILVKSVAAAFNKEEVTA